MTLRVLVVDDDDGMRFAVCRALEGEGHVVLSCERSAEALTALQSTAFDVLITDLVMPGMGGRELVAAARALNGAIRCVIMSGQSRDEGLAEHVEWLGKPFDIDDLIARVVQKGTPP